MVEGIEIPPFEVWLGACPVGVVPVGVLPLGVLAGGVYVPVEALATLNMKLPTVWFPTLQDSVHVPETEASATPVELQVPSLFVCPMELTFDTPLWTPFTDTGLFGWAPVMRIIHGWPIWSCRFLRSRPVVGSVKVRVGVSVLAAGAAVETGV